MGTADAATAAAALPAYKNTTGERGCHGKLPTTNKNAKAVMSAYLAKSLSLLNGSLCDAAGGRISGGLLLLIVVRIALAAIVIPALLGPVCQTCHTTIMTNA